LAGLDVGVAEGFVEVGAEVGWEGAGVGCFGEDFNCLPVVVASGGDEAEPGEGAGGEVGWSWSMGEFGLEGGFGFVEVAVEVEFEFGVGDAELAQGGAGDRLAGLEVVEADVEAFGEGTQGGEGGATLAGLDPGEVGMGDAGDGGLLLERQRCRRRRRMRCPTVSVGGLSSPAGWLWAEWESLFLCRGRGGWARPGTGYSGAASGGLAGRAARSRCSPRAAAPGKWTWAAWM
jgi:hypothetical protein